MSAEIISLAITLDDGRELIAVPGPEDQGRLAELGFSDIVSISAGQGDTSGHIFGSDLDVDVEGHAMTLRLPTNADAEALRKALALGAVTATLVAAGAIAALSNPAAPSIPQSVTVPHAGPAPVTDFQTRREQQTDKLLEAPAPIVQPVDTINERIDRISPAAGAGAGAAAGSAAASAPTGSFEERREQKADKLLEAPEPLAQPSDVSTN